MVRLILIVWLTYKKLSADIAYMLLITVSIKNLDHCSQSLAPSACLKNKSDANNIAADWKQRHAGVLGISYVARGFSENNVLETVKSIVPLLDDRVRFFVAFLLYVITKFFFEI